MLDGDQTKPGKENSETKCRSRGRLDGHHQGRRDFPRQGRRGHWRTEKVGRKSPTLRANRRRAKGEVFDGDADNFSGKIIEDNLQLQQRHQQGQFRTTRASNSAAFMPEARGQAAATAIYMRGQLGCGVLDSFRDGADNEWRLFHQQADRQRLPPHFPGRPSTRIHSREVRRWQEHEERHCTIKHNGIVIHDAGSSQGTPQTPKAPANSLFWDRQPGCLRNIWVWKK
jgi:hypothetical protein